MAELTVMAPLGDREVEMRQPSEGSLMVLAKIFRGLPKGMIENPEEMPEEMRAKLISNLGTLGKIVDAMIVNDDDKDWLDDTMIEGSVSAEDVFGAIRYANEHFAAGTAPAKKATKAVRRAR